MTDRNPPKVFISYSNDSPAHTGRVRALADQLVGKGVDIQLDQYIVEPPRGWYHWARKQVNDSDFVLAICTRVYLERLDGEAEPGTGLGATFEGTLLLNEFVRAQGKNTKTIPVVFDPADILFIPDFLGGPSRYNVDSDEGFASLLRRLQGKPAADRPPIGDFELEADIIAGAGPVPKVIATSGYFRVVSLERADAYFQGDNFSFEARGIELGLVGPYVCSPCQETELELSSTVTGSFLGRGPATLGSEEFDNLAYGGRITLFAPRVKVNAKRAREGIKDTFTLSAFIEGYLRSAFVPDPAEPSFRVQVYGEGKVEVDFAITPPREGLGELYDTTSVEYRISAV